MAADDELKMATVKADEVPFAPGAVEAPMLFVDDIRGAAIINGMVRLNLVQTRIDPANQQLSSKVATVLVVPLEMVRNWGPFLVKHFPPEPQAEPTETDGQ